MKQLHHLFIPETYTLPVIALQLELGSAMCSYEEQYPKFCHLTGVQENSKAYHTFCVPQFAIIDAHFTKEIFGYTDEEWKNGAFFKGIPGAYAILHACYGLKAYVLFSKRGLAKLGHHLVYITKIPFRCRNGTYVLLTQESYLMQHDASNRLISNFTVFTVIDDLGSEVPPMKISPMLFYKGSRESMRPIEQELKRLATQDLIYELKVEDEDSKLLMFSPIEILCAQLTMQGYSSVTIAGMLNKSKNIVDFHKRELLHKARVMFVTSQFPDCGAVARFLNQNGLLPPNILR